MRPQRRTERSARLPDKRTGVEAAANRFEESAVL